MSGIENKDKIEIETNQPQEQIVIWWDQEISQKVEDVLSLEGFIQSSEYKAFMQKMADNLSALNALLNSKDEVIDIVKNFDAVVRKCSENQANIILEGRHGLIHNDVILNILYRNYDLTQWYFGIPGNAKVQEKVLLWRTVDLKDVTEIQIRNRNHFLDYLETLLKRIFELWLGKENVEKL